jgi:hypothetical protein
MPALLVYLDGATIRAIDRVSSKRKRSAFIRAAIRRAIRDAEYERMRCAYVLRMLSGRIQRSRPMTGLMLRSISEAVGHLVSAVRRWSRRTGSESPRDTARSKARHRMWRERRRSAARRLLH